MSEHVTGVQPIVVAVAAGATCVCGKVLDKDLHIRLGRYVGKGRGRWRLTSKIGKHERFRRTVSRGLLLHAQEDLTAYIATHYALACSNECARTIEQTQQIAETLTED